MSLAEMKNELRRLTPAELRELEKLLAEIRTENGEAAARVREAAPDDADVPAAVDAVFGKHRELLRKLAQ
jgi:hypothetical protein